MYICGELQSFSLSLSPSVFLYVNIIYFDVSRWPILFSLCPFASRAQRSEDAFFLLGPMIILRNISQMMLRRTEHDTQPMTPPTTTVAAAAAPRLTCREDHVVEQHQQWEKRGERWVSWKMGATNNFLSLSLSLILSFNRWRQQDTNT